jgi:hypothetical protein
LISKFKKERIDIYLKISIYKVPPKKIIAVALKFGWKEKNIIKLYLPKRDKYENKKEKDEEIEQSIVIFFTWRYLKKA